MQRWLAIDIGGTKVAGALVHADGEVCCAHSEPTQATGNEQMAAQLQRLARQVCAEADISVNSVAGVGVAIPGGVDRERGIALGGVNLGIHNLPVADIFGELTSAPVALENDTNAGALGEKWFGAGRDIQDFAYMAVGTGVGGGLILRGQLYVGSKGGAGEVGHTIVDPNALRCKCGQIGCLEAMASGVGMPLLAEKLLGEEKARQLGRGELPSPPQIYAAAAEGDEGAARVVTEVGRLLAVSVVGLFRLLDVERVIVGGGVAGVGETFLTAIYEGAEALGYTHLKPGDVVLSPLGSKANLLGAAAVVREKALS
ncbi:MAG: ROK family protein [Limnochordia bacterium]